MQTKTPDSSVSNQQVQQPLGQPVIFKSEKPSGSGISLPSGSLKTVLASFVMLFLVGGVGVGVYLVGQNQQLKSKASNELPPNLSKIVSNDVVNPAATRSAQASSSARPATGSGTSLSQIVIPNLNASSSAESSASGELAQYDFNSDGSANSVDLSVMYAGWGRPKSDLQIKADLNHDGIINGIDYSQFVQHFNQKL